MSRARSRFTKFSPGCRFFPAQAEKDVSNMSNGSNMSEMEEEDGHRVLTAATSIAAMFFVLGKC